MIVMAKKYREMEKLYRWALGQSSELAALLQKERKRAGRIYWPATAYCEVMGEGDTKETREYQRTRGDREAWEVFLIRRSCFNEMKRLLAEQSKIIDRKNKDILELKRTNQFFQDKVAMSSKVADRAWFLELENKKLRRWIEDAPEKYRVIEIQKAELKEKVSKLEEKYRKLKEENIESRKIEGRDDMKRHRSVEYVTIGTSYLEN